jgi:hypothetical protein
MRLRYSSLLKKYKCGNTGCRKNSRGYEHRYRNELIGAHPLILGPCDIHQRSAQAEETTDVAEAPAPARYFSECAATCQFRQKCRDQIFTAAEKKIGQNNQQNRQPEIAGANEIKQRRK